MHSPLDDQNQSNDRPVSSSNTLSDPGAKSPQLDQETDASTDPGWDDLEWEAELGEVIQRFDTIQSELNYKQARDVLRELVAHLDLTEQERQGLEPEIQGLETMLQKLEESIVHIAVFGMVGRGKSSLLNALVGEAIFEVGPIHGVTQHIHSTRWTVATEQDGQTAQESDVLRVVLQGQGNSRIELLDTPGIDEVDGEKRELLARQVAKQADLILFVVAGDLTRVEFQALSTLREASKPILLVFNKVDQYPEADRLTIYQKIRDERVKELLSPDEIVMVAASPLVAQAVRRPDGRMTTQVSRGQPQVERLKLKILDVLDREGKSLVALNTMLFASDINEHLVERKMAIREESANQLIWNATMTKAVAIALNPFTVVDLLSGVIIDITMILTLSKLYGISMTQQGAIKLLQRIALSMGGIGASELLTTLSLSSLKSLLGISAPLTGGASLSAYLSVAVAQAGIAGVSSYTIGQVTKIYLANGASWGADGPKAVVTQILDSLNEGSILSRIKDELRAKLDWKTHLRNSADADQELKL